MFATSGDILKMSLAAGFIVFIIFICILIFYTILVMRDVSKITDDVEDVVSKIHKSIMKPLSAIDFLVERLEPYVESVLAKKRRTSKTKKKKK